MKTLSSTPQSPGLFSASPNPTPANRWSLLFRAPSTVGGPAPPKSAWCLICICMTHWTLLRRLEQGEWALPRVEPPD